jgi:hypothetical protein
MSNIETTNLFLGIMAGVSLLQFLMLVTALIVGYRAYRRVSERFDLFDQERLAPIAEKAQAVVQDVQRLTSQVASQTERVEQALNHTAERFEERAERVKTNVRRRVVPMVAAVRTFKDAMRQNGTTASDAGFGAETDARLAAARAVEHGEPWPSDAEPSKPSDRDAYWAPSI